MSGPIAYQLPDLKNYQNVSTATPLPVSSASAATTSAPVVTSSAAPADRWFYAGVTGGITDTADVAIKTAAGASIKNYLVRIQAGNGSAVASEIVVKDGSTIIWRGYIPATSGQINVAFDPPLQSTANTALNVAMITTATATRVSAQGYVGA